MDIKHGTIVKSFDGEDYELQHTIDEDEVNDIKEFIRDIDPGSIIIAGIDQGGDKIYLPLDYFECVEALLDYAEIDPPLKLSLIFGDDKYEIII